MVVRPRRDPDRLRGKKKRRVQEAEAIQSSSRKKMVRATGIASVVCRLHAQLQPKKGEPPDRKRLQDWKIDIVGEPDARRPLAPPARQGKTVADVEISWNGKGRKKKRKNASHRCAYRRGMGTSCTSKGVFNDSEEQRRQRLRPRKSLGKKGKTGREKEENEEPQNQMKRTKQPLTGKKWRAPHKTHAFP